MKPLLFVLSFSLIASPAFGGAMPLPKTLEKCKVYEKSKAYKDAKSESASALAHSNRAEAKNNSFQATCESISSKGQYNDGNAVSALRRDGEASSKASIDAIKALDKSKRSLTKFKDALNAIGATKDCLDDAEALAKKLGEKEALIKSQMEKLKTCTESNTEESGQTSQAQRTAAPVSLPPCFLLPDEEAKPGENCTEEHRGNAE